MLWSDLQGGLSIQLAVPVGFQMKPSAFQDYANFPGPGL